MIISILRSCVARIGTGLLATTLLMVAGCGGGTTATSNVATTGNNAGTTGIELYSNNCARCHGSDRQGTVYGKTIISTTSTIANSTEQQLSTLISFHRAGLHLTPEQLSALATFLKNP